MICPLSSLILTFLCRITEDDEEGAFDTVRMLRPNEAAAPYVDVADPAPYLDVSEPAPYFDVADPAPYLDIGNPDPRLPKNNAPYVLSVCLFVCLVDWCLVVDLFV